MRRALTPVLILIAACSGDGAPPTTADGPLKFRIIEERVNAAFCRPAPDFAVAATEPAWIDVFDMQTECRPEGEVDLPGVAFETEVGIAAWWRRVPCLGYTIRTESVARSGAQIVVRASSTQPQGVCAQAVAQLESFIAVERSERFDGTQPVRFELDGTQAGYANKP